MVDVPVDRSARQRRGEGGAQLADGVGCGAAVGRVKGWVVWDALLVLRAGRCSRKEGSAVELLSWLCGSVMRGLAAARTSMMPSSVHSQIESARQGQARDMTTSKPTVGAWDAQPLATRH